MAWKDLRLAEIVEHIPLAVLVTRPDGRIEYANGRAHELLDTNGNALIGDDLGTFRHEDVAGAAGGGDSWQQESRFRTRAGEAILVLEAAYPLFDDGGGLACRIHFLHDLRAEKRLEILSTLAYRDVLTCLPNRLLFQDRLDRALLATGRTGIGFALLYIDIDRFKTINDTLGHAAGDRLLRETAARMNRALRRSDTLARVGGDEFAVILEAADGAAAASRIADKLIAACREPFELGDPPVRIGVSIGIALCPRHARDATALLGLADRAMYAAKAAGRDRSLIAAPPSSAPGVRAPVAPQYRGTVVHLRTAHASHVLDAKRQRGPDT